MPIPSFPMRLASMCGLLFVFLALTACGESGDREELESMIHTAMASRAPGSCLKFETLRFLESTSGREGQAAIDACEEEDPFEEQPRKVGVSRVDIDGDSATALVAFSGSLFDGQEVEYGFVERKSSWKFDEMVGFVDLDSAHLVFELGRLGMLRAKSPQEVANISCWIDRMGRMSDEALEDLLFGDGDYSSECAAKSPSV